MTIFEFFQYFSTNIWIYGGTFILVLSILVFVHEWGHYIVARMCGVGIESFSIGFGKEIFGWTDKNGTRWKFSLIPLGGYVKMIGDVDPASAGHSEDVEDKETGEIRPLSEGEKHVAFFNKPVWKRALIVFAGPAINYIFAIILFAALFTTQGKPVTPPVAAAVMSGSAADEYGFQPHDYILSIDGKQIQSFEDIRQEMAIALDEEKLFIVRRGNDTVEISAKPRLIEQEDRFGFKHSRGLLGLISPRQALSIESITAIDGQSFNDPQLIREEISSRYGDSFEVTIKRGEDKSDTFTIAPLAQYNENLMDVDSTDSQILYIANFQGREMAHFGPLEGIGEAIYQSYDITLGTLEALGQMVTGTRSATELGGIIRIGAVAGDMAQQGWIALIMFTALLSINLGLINLFPIPMLDGGHLVFYAFEAAAGKPIPERMQEYAFRFGLVLLVGLMVFANLNDLMQLIL